MLFRSSICFPVTIGADAFGGCLLHDRQPYLRNDYKEIDGDDDGLWGITDRDGEFDLVLRCVSLDRS